MGRGTGGVPAAPLAWLLLAHLDAIANVIPVDASVRGYPPSPTALLQVIFDLVGARQR